jgi:phage terminase large subunit
MLIETQIKLDRFEPRPYQLPILDAIINKGYKKVICVLPRRSGKDVLAFNLVIREALRRVGNYFMVYPTYAQGKKILWLTITLDGKRFIDFIPPELIESINESEMRIRLTNQSTIQVVGSENFDNLVGTNPVGCVFSEMALQDNRCYQFLRPALKVADGFALFISTPRGHNHFWELWNIAVNFPNEWFAYRKTVEDTQHVSIWELQQEIARGEISQDHYSQEYMCSFDLGTEGAYYSKFMNKMVLEGRIGIVPYEPGFRVHCAFDLGVHDLTVVIMYQCIGQIVRIVDYYQNSDKGLDHYAKILESKGYLWGTFFFPHDIAVRELSTGLSRLEAFKKLMPGVKTSVLPNLPIDDGIECVKAALSSKIWIDETKCAQLIRSLESYRREYDPHREKYKEVPLHDKHSHAADAMRYLCLSLPKTRDGLSPEDLDKRYQQAMGGDRNANMPSIFRDDLPPY